MSQFLSIFTTLLGQVGVIVVVGMLIFFITYKYSVNIFDWVEHQTYGTRNYLTEKLEFLFIEIPPEKITYILLGSSLGLTKSLDFGKLSL